MSTSYTLNKESPNTIRGVKKKGIFKKIEII